TPAAPTASSPTGTRSSSASRSAWRPSPRCARAPAARWSATRACKPPRRPRGGDAMAEKRRARPGAGSPGHPPGKPLEVYSAKAKAITYLIVGVVLALIGAGGLAYGLPRGEEGLMGTLIGGLFAVAAPVFIAVALFNLK